MVHRAKSTGRYTVLIAVLLGMFAGTLWAAEAVATANSNPTYQALRTNQLGSEAVAVNGLVLKRDAGTFTLQLGTVCFAAPVEGKVTSAVFVGNGRFELDPPTASEKKSLAHLTKQPRMDEAFDHMVLRFTDATYDELKKAGTTISPNCPAGLLNDNLDALRKKLKLNFTERLLEDVLSPAPGSFFAAFIKGKQHSQMLYMLDPYDEEEVSLQTYGDDMNSGLWTQFHYSEEYRTGKGVQPVPLRARIEKQRIDLKCEKNAYMSGKTTTTFVAQYDGIRVLRLQLFRTLRVSGVTGEDGQALGFIQEDKDEDADFAVILPKPLTKGQRYSITTAYAGKNALHSEGNGNYYLESGARESWYPSNGMNDYSTYEIRMTVPKDMKIVVSGDRVSEQVQDGALVSEWRTQPQRVAGFHFGRFKREDAEIKEIGGFVVESYANAELPDVLKDVQRADTHDVEGAQMHIKDVGGLTQSMSTTPMLKQALGEAQLAMRVYTDYFGPTPYKRLAVTQQTASYYGQSWPELVWLPLSYFLDPTMKNYLGVWDRRGYFRTVEPHEIAHQWWGHTVGWTSYRDQWMSEGFSDFSASLFLWNASGKPQDAIAFWNDERDLLLERNKEGFRAIDAGPVTMGYRASTSKTGWDITQRLIYPKGAYILHMIRMMMWQPKTGDQQFKDLMHDFVKTYTNRTASTEDFKAMVEKHMTPEMNLTRDGKMDWFFNEYVYGTALPKYNVNYTMDDAQGGFTLNLQVTQSGVDDGFKMLVPVYLEFANGNVARIGTVALAGNANCQQKIPLPLKEKPRRVILNYFNDVLCDKD